MTNTQTTLASDPLFGLAGKTTLITAAGSGIGRATAELFAERGAHVIAVDMNRDRIEEVVQQIKKDGGSAEAHTVDLTNQAELDAFLTLVLDQHRVLDILYNHAGIAGPYGLDYDSGSYGEAFNLNVWVGAVTTQRLLPLLRSSSASSIIFTASQAGLVGVANLPVYSATKGAVIQYMKSIALMLAPEGIRANAICPGATDSRGMRASVGNTDVEAALEAIGKNIPMGRVAQPPDMASVALFLATDASRYVTGVAIAVDGGATAT